MSSSIVLYTVVVFFAIFSVSISAAPLSTPVPIVSGIPEFRCDYTFNANLNGFLKFHEKPATWKGAKSICHYEGAKLFTPQDVTTNDVVKALMDSYSKKEIFTGVSAINSNGYYFDLKGKPFTTSRWSASEPNSKSEETCVTFLQKGTFADTRCDKKKCFICHKAYKNEKPNQCGTIDEEYKFNDTTGKCYKFHKLSKVWKKAHLICAAEGSHLAIVNSIEESNAIGSIFNSHPPRTLRASKPLWENVAFVGFRYDDSTDRYETLDGQSLREAGFDSFQFEDRTSPAPGNLCGVVNRSGLLDVSECEEDHVFICEREPGYHCSNK